MLEKHIKLVHQPAHKPNFTPNSWIANLKFVSLVSQI